MTDNAKTPHYLVIAKDTIGDDLGEVRLELICTAPAGAPCRRRPPEGDDRETWDSSDPDLVDGDCWATEWVSLAGWESVATGHAELARIPVSVTYDEGVLVEPAPAETIVRHRDAATGEFVTAEEAAERPEATIRETGKP